MSNNVKEYEMKQRVHATLEATVRRDPLLKQSLLDTVLHQIHIVNLDEGRFRRFGIISGDIDPAQIDDMRSLTGIKSVEEDQQKSAQGALR
jgi:hypothetical protein